jgi:hypothetical protein
LFVRQFCHFLAVLPCCPPVHAQVDFIAVSFVRTADVITNLRSYIETRTAPGCSQAAAGADNNSNNNNHINNADVA